MHYLSLIVILLKLFSGGDIAQVIEDGWLVKSQENRPFDYAVTYRDNGAEVVMPKVEGRSPIYSTQSIGEGQFLLAYEKTHEDGTVTNRYDLLDVLNKSLQFLSESNSQTSGTYGLGMYVKATELLIQTYAFESIESVDLKGKVKTIAGQHGWSVHSPDGRYLAVQSGMDNEVKTTVFDLEEGTSVDCPLVPKIDYVFSPLALTFSPDSRYFFSMPKVWGDQINIFESVSGKLVENINVSGATLSSPRWSPDGQRLSCLIQMKEEAPYSVETTNLARLFGSRFGIYDLVSKEETQVMIPDGRLVFSAGFSQSGDAVFLKTVSKKSCLQWVKDGESPSSQPVDLDIYLIEKQQTHPVVHEFLEGIQENYWLNIEGFYYQGDVAVFYRITGPSTSEIVSLDLNTLQETIIRSYPEVVQITKNEDWLYIMASSGLDRISISGDIQVEKISEVQGIIMPNEDAFLSESTDGNKTILSIHLMK
jgi:hypothetical protein